ncbi:carabin isoform X1 [Nycticebus coucang]|uniref:carabin isoform X1 n=1 Tax=Nycticebus coucang TaxID=9470 RepID=UPI00234C5853|nr:carabin isoform X1 [Nycticebus coucang]XP_053417443.1 carabin isoform X1 [Nycticebus coucang]XP_053417444.1 carabin isoform X1 [Nycticebus coucang]
MAQALGEDLMQTSELQDDSSSLGSDSELSGPGPYRQADRYGFIGGSSTESGPGYPAADLIRQREMKWVEMTSHWEKTMSRRYKKVKMQCRKGIPSALRARCWPLLCGAHVCQKNSPGTYQVREWAGNPPPFPRTSHHTEPSHPQELAEAPGDPQWMETIGRDLHRQFPLHEMFVSPQGHGQQGLLQVLKAYTLYRPEQGYCQAQGPVAAVLLMHLPPEEAFWCLVQICEVYLPGYYGPHMEAVQLDAEVFMALLRRLLPRVHKHLQQVGVGPLLYLPEWFLCLFARSLPFPTVLRVWDAFLSEGVKVLFRVGLTLVRLALGTAEQRRACPGLLETLGALRAIPPAQLQEEVFISQVHSVALSERDLQQEIRAQLAQLPKSAPGPPPQPQARLSGAQAIFEAQQLAGARRGAKPEVPRIVVQPPEEPRPPRRKPQTRGKTFHGLLTRARGPPLEGPPRSHRGSASFLDTRF